MRPTGLAVIMKPATPNAAPGVLPPPASNLAQPSFRNPEAVIWKTSTAVVNCAEPEPNPMAMR